MSEPIRLQKLLAGSGLGSRRAVEDWIRDGRITVNGQPASLGQRATAEDDVRFDGKRLTLLAANFSAPCEVLIYHKPADEVTTRHDPGGRATVFDRLPAPATGRWIVVGRLDVNTSGLLLFTNDGDLAAKLMHPSSEVPREYLVRLRGTPTDAALTQLRSGVQLEDGPARFDTLTPETGSDGHSYFRVTLHEGRNREVRRLWEAVGYEVSRLLRVAYGSLKLPRELRAAQWRQATKVEVAALRRDVALE